MDLEEILSHKGRTKKELRALSLDALDTLTMCAMEIIEEKKKEEEVEAQRRKERNKVIEELRHKMAELGISDDEFISGPGFVKRDDSRPKKKVPPKYKITTPDGKEVTWTGRGKTPKAFEGISKEDLDQNYAI
jgi:DNA-binding protein H-NS